LAAFVGAMPGQELGVNLVDLCLQLRIFLGQDREQLPSQGRQALISLDAIEQLIESGTCFAGTPDDVFNQIKALNDSVGGFGNLLMFGQGGSLDHADTVANITLFAKEVLPRLRELNPAPARAEVAAQ
jgi:hypothetical protein